MNIELFESDLVVGCTDKKNPSISDFRRLPIPLINRATNIIYYSIGAIKYFKKSDEDSIVLSRAADTIIKDYDVLWQALQSIKKESSCEWSSESIKRILDRVTKPMAIS